MKKTCLVWVAVLALTACVQSAWAGELDVLLEKLVEKGVLSPVEAIIIKDETKQAVSSEVSTQKSYATPEWVQKMKLKGDLRVRHQYERKTSDTEGRNRGRIRLRMGVEANVVDQVKVGFGLATGGSDPRSTNQTLQNTFDTPDIRLDYAYAEYMPFTSLSGIVGKFKMGDYLWNATDFLWDGDINPEGASIRHQGDLGALGLKSTHYFVNTGAWILDDNDQVDREDPWMKYVQGGLQWEDEKVSLKGALTFYHFTGIKDIALDNSSGTNTLGNAGGLLSSYHSLSTSTEIAFNQLFGGLPFHIDDKIVFLGDYIHNLDDDLINEGDVDGWAYGVRFGHAKLGDAGTWQAQYVKSILGKDAWLDTFPDSDRLEGKTDVLSHKTTISYSLRKNVILGVNYYQSRRWAAAGSSSNDTEHLVQADVLFKF